MQQPEVATPRDRQVVDLLTRSPLAKLANAEAAPKHHFGFESTVSKSQDVRGGVVLYAHPRSSRRRDAPRTW